MCLMTAALHGCYIAAETFSAGFGENHAQHADNLMKRGQYREAINEYQQHLNSRLADRTRAPDENPHFYLVLIGDAYVKLNEPKAAKSAYEQALAHNVEREIISDRLRGLGRWYAERKAFDEAIQVLREHRELDAIMFDYEIDRTHKLWVDHEENTQK